MPYHRNVVSRVGRTTGLSLGTRLGKYCVNNNVPVTEIAEEFGVSRQTVYNWFFGLYDVDKEKQQEVISYLDARNPS